VRDLERIARLLGRAIGLDAGALLTKDGFSPPMETLDDGMYLSLDHRSVDFDAASVLLAGVRLERRTSRSQRRSA